jgi:hypothetical protein
MTVLLAERTLSKSERWFEKRFLQMTFFSTRGITLIGVDLFDSNAILIFILSRDNHKKQ